MEDIPRRKFKPKFNNINYKSSDFVTRKLAKKITQSELTQVELFTNNLSQNNKMLSTPTEIPGDMYVALHECINNANTAISEVVSTTEYLVSEKRNNPTNKAMIGLIVKEKMQKSV